MENTSTHSSNNNSTKYTGVRKRKWGKYVSEIRLPNSRERIWLGSYDSAAKAARAFDAALYCLRGPTAKFNFPDNPPNIPGGRSLTPAQIQVEAARFAHSGRVGSDHEGSCSFGSGQETKQVDSPSVSDGKSTCTTHVGNVDSNNDNSYLDHFRVTGSDPEFGYFPGFDDFQNELLLAGPSVDYYEVEESCDEYNGSYLWSF